MDFNTKANLFRVYTSMQKSAGVAEDAAAMQGEYENEVASPLSSAGLGGAMGLMGGAAGLALSRMGHGLGMQAGNRMAQMLPGKWGTAAALLASAALPAMAGYLQEYTTRDERAQDMMKRDLGDIQSDIMTGMDISQMSPEQKMLLLNRAAEIQNYLGAGEQGADTTPMDNI